MAADRSYGDKSQLPLAGVILCCTSIPPEQRSELSMIAAQMGASSKLDLTSDVTHLIVGDLDTPKYKYVAKERPDVKCLLPAWVNAVREAWMEGGELDVEAYEVEYKLPTFMGLKICVTGFEDLAFRKQVELSAKANGAEYRGDLSKEITHLIALAPTGAKYKHAKLWGIKTVTIEWFEQSLERGMVLDEALYDPLLEPSEIGRGAWVRRSASVSSLGKRRREDDPLGLPGRKLRRSASSKFDSQNDGFWSDITMAAPQPQPVRKPEWGNDETERETSHQASVVPESMLNSNQSKQSAPQNKPHPRGMFYGKRFYLHGFDPKQTSILERHLSSHDAETVCDFSQETQQSTLTSASYLLVPYSSPSDDIPYTQNTSVQNIMTDFWVEKCLYKKEFVDPSSNVTYNPFKFPVQGFDELVITSTAFEGIELLHLSKIVKLLGAKYTESLSPHTSVLVCNNSSLSREKVKAALEWRVPAVKADWLWDSMRSGQKKNFDEYLLYPKSQPLGDLAKHPKISTAARLPVRSSPQASKGALKVKDQTKPEAHPEKSQTDSPAHGPFAEDDDGPAPFTAENNVSINDIHEDQPKSPSKPGNTDKLGTHVRPEPLKERSPNSPTRPSVSPSKSTTSATASYRVSDRESLSDAISSLLAHHKSKSLTNAHDASTIERANSNNIGPDANSTSRRRTRKLLGRAASNLSNRSGSIANLTTKGLSRTSSVGTLNTDDLGTPIEIPAAVPFLKDRDPTPDSASLTTSALTTHDELLAVDDDEEEGDGQPTQLTQVGYEDPEAGKWRARLMKKIGARTKDATNGEKEDEEEAEPGDRGRIRDDAVIVAAGGVGTLEDELEGPGSVRRTRRSRGLARA